MKEPLKQLFEEWKQEQDVEVDEIEKKINEIWDNKAPGIKNLCEGLIFEQYYYKNKEHDKNISNTISSHFVQFFYKDSCKMCKKGKESMRAEEKVWRYVLKNAFNMDGCVGEFEVKNGGYKYVFLLKEANDSSKVCIENYPVIETKKEAVNIWLQDWVNGAKASMLDILREALEQYLCFEPETLDKKEFINRAAYMNVNKRGGAAQTLGIDENAVINYAKRYREYILREISILSGDNDEVIVFVCGKSKKYWEKLMSALTNKEFEKRQYECIYNYSYNGNNTQIRFINITHPSKPGIKAEILKRDMIP